MRDIIGFVCKMVRVEVVRSVQTRLFTIYGSRPSGALVKLSPLVKSRSKKPFVFASNKVMRVFCILQLVNVRIKRTIFVFHSNEH